MTKAGLTATLASSVAALAASAANANDAPQMKAASKASARSGRAVPDPDQENARSRSRPAKGNKRATAAEAGAEAGADADTPGHVGAMTHADQTRVLVSGLAEDVAAELIEDAFSDAGPVRHIKMGKGKATVHFVLATDAARCVAEMQGVEIAGQPLKLVLAESAESAAASAGGDGERTGDSNKAQPNYTKLNTRLFRLVIRNLPFGIKEAAVRSAFQRFGTLEEVHLPIKPGRDGKEQSRGFGFLQFSTRAEAKLALEQGNGTEILGRPVAVDWAVAKEIYQQAVPDKNKAAQGKGEGADQHVADSEAGGKKRKGGALEKEAGGKAEIDVNPEGRTVFIRNIPLEAEEHQVREVMRRFGKIVYLKLVIDKVTGKHKGSAFAQFSSAEAAEAACSAGGAFTGTESWEQVQRKKDKRLQSSAVRGVLDGFQETLSMFGRHLFVALAVDKKQAKELGAAEKQKLDPRNLHLAKIGVVLEDSPEAKNMPAADLAKRVRDWQEKKSKLANTNFSVNRTRLSVRNVAKGVTEAQLKAVFHDAVVRALAGAGGAASGKEKKDSAGDAANVGPVKVVGANLVRDKTKIDPATSLPLTKGYGFVEFTEHAHALLAVKHVNNSASVAKQHNAGKRLMVDFALDDARIVRQRRIKQVRVERAKQRRAEAAKAEADELGDDKEHKSRGAKQRAKKRSRAADPHQHDDPAQGQGGQQGSKKAKTTAGGKVSWGSATTQDAPDKQSRDLSKPYREKGNKDGTGLVRAGGGRRAPAPADPRGAKAAEAAAAAKAAKASNKGDGRQSRKGAALGAEDAHLASVVAEVGDLMPKTKKARKNRDRTDDFDALASKYQSSLFKDAASDRRWFD